MSYMDIIPEEDLKAYGKRGYGNRMGFGRRPAVVVVDMTNGFVDPKYPTASHTSRTMGGKAVDAIGTLLTEARIRSIPVVYTTPAEKTGLLFDVGVSRKGAEKVLREGQAPSDPRENAIIGAIAPKKGDLVIQKIKASAFFCTPLVSYLTYLNVDTLILTGMTTSGCVRASVVDAASYNFRVVVPEEGVADRAVVPHKVNLFDMAMKYADVMPLFEVVNAVRTLTPEPRTS